MAKSTPFTNKACQLANNDVQASRQEFLFRLPSSILNSDLVKVLQDPRDITCLQLVANILLTAVPVAVMLHAINLQSHLLGMLYLLLNYALYLQVSRAVTYPHAQSQRSCSPAAQHLCCQHHTCMFLAGQPFTQFRTGNNMKHE